ncbi:peptide chain release factor N(5)-glutamine methyltransferase [Brevibacterium spongiae]|uniref:peptide chain release factor N(5)-glutamine methyltransferase n=1 Tax=Brevibacterium spongiae TaxID=2909672 RepID=A0ABY5SU23_9MICO|nr:peptide chain release factor N(5)-glutamine methyltransferase [Brevibacterium spongiae]UVI37640.1 peptide chain release factor N(5)-glutamine methyltransferase [Brevibacterium spongiae]
MNDVLRGGIRLLAEAGVPTPEADAAELLAHAWHIDRTNLSRRRLFDENVPADTTAEFARLCEQRRQRIPLQHLTGIAHFRHLELRVGPGVFVPRPETELLAGAALDELSAHHGDRRPFVIDLCSGSGAITLSVATEYDGVDVLGVEREADALEWARMNLEQRRLGDSSIEFIRGDATTFARERPELRGLADIVVTNPPYVPNAAIPRDPEVAEHDPSAALYGGDTGLEVPALIIDQATELLRVGGLFLMEHSEEQGAGVRELIAETASLNDAVTYQDYTGRDRFTAARRAQQ